MSLVQIDQNTKVCKGEALPAWRLHLLYVCDTAMSMLHTAGAGVLEFADDDSIGDVSLDAKWIMVRGRQSALRVGTETTPFSQRATITLHSRRYTAKEIPSYGAKNIAVRYGTLDLHGQPKTPTWTRLGATVEAGSSTIVLVESVNWQAGDKIAIASSVWSPDQVEDRFVSSVSSDGVTLTLDRPLQFTHWGDLVVCFPSIWIAEHCCAAVLSRVLAPCQYPAFSIASTVHVD